MSLIRTWIAAALLSQQLLGGLALRLDDETGINGEPLYPHAPAPPPAGPPSSALVSEDSGSAASAPEAGQAQSSTGQTESQAPMTRLDGQVMVAAGSATDASKLDGPQMSDSASHSGSTQAQEEPDYDGQDEQTTSSSSSSPSSISESKSSSKSGSSSASGSGSSNEAPEATSNPTTKFGIREGEIVSDVTLEGSCAGTTSDGLYTCGETRSPKKEHKKFIKWRFPHAEGQRDFIVQSKFKVAERGKTGLAFAIWTDEDVRLVGLDNKDGKFFSEGGAWDGQKAYGNTTLSVDTFHTIRLERKHHELRVFMDGNETSITKQTPLVLDKRVVAVGWRPWHNTIHVEYLRGDEGKCVTRLEKLAKKGTKHIAVRGIDCFELGSMVQLGGHNATVAGFGESSENGPGSLLLHTPLDEDLAEGTVLTGEGQVACVDLQATCASFAAGGQCEVNPVWMVPNCRKSCDSCLDFEGVAMRTTTTSTTGPPDQAIVGLKEAGHRVWTAQKEAALKNGNAKRMAHRAKDQLDFVKTSAKAVENAEKVAQVAREQAGTASAAAADKTLKADLFKAEWTLYKEEERNATRDKQASLKTYAEKRKMALIKETGKDSALAMARKTKEAAAVFKKKEEAKKKIVEEAEAAEAAAYQDDQKKIHTFTIAKNKRAEAEQAETLAEEEEKNASDAALKATEWSQRLGDRAVVLQALSGSATSEADKAAKNAQAMANSEQVVVAKSKASEAARASLQAGQAAAEASDKLQSFSNLAVQNIEASVKQVLQ